MTSSLDDLENMVGHPGDRWNTLKARVQDSNITRFSVVQDEFLGLVWCLDQYRVNGIPPRNMGKPGQADETRLAAVYRGKGNWFATLVALLLENQTNSRLAPRSRVKGFSQSHQVDVAWPAREEPIEDPLVCAETKMTGAPAYGRYPARRATADWTNRRKELKFAATDLKLYRRSRETQIDHWDTWRKSESPKTYFLWCARMAPSDKISSMVEELRALNETYLDGAALFAYIERPGGGGYDAVAMTQRDRVAQLDDLLHLIASVVKNLSPDGSIPPPRVPAAPAVNLAALAEESAND